MEAGRVQATTLATFFGGGAHPCALQERQAVRSWY